MHQNAFAAAGGAYSAPQTPSLDLGEGMGKGRKGKPNPLPNKKSGYSLA